MLTSFRFLTNRLSPPFFPFRNTDLHLSCLTSTDPSGTGTYALLNVKQRAHIELRLRRTSDFMGSIILPFVLQDVNMLLVSVVCFINSEQKRRRMLTFFDVSSLLFISFPCCLCILTAIIPPSPHRPSSSFSHSMSPVKVPQAVHSMAQRRVTSDFSPSTSSPCSTCQPFITFRITSCRLGTGGRLQLTIPHPGGSCVRIDSLNVPPPISPCYGPFCLSI